MSVSHSDPDKVKWAERLAEKYPPDMNAPFGLPNVLRTGKVEYYPDITEEMLAEGTEDPEYLALLKTVQFRGVVIAPIVSPRGVLGALGIFGASREGDAALPRRSGPLQAVPSRESIGRSIE